MSHYLFILNGNLIWKWLQSTLYWLNNTCKKYFSNLMTLSQMNRTSLTVNICFDPIQRKKMFFGLSIIQFLLWFHGTNECVYSIQKRLSEVGNEFSIFYILYIVSFIFVSPHFIVALWTTFERSHTGNNFETNNWVIFFISYWQFFCWKKSTLTQQYKQDMDSGKEIVSMKHK